MKPGQSFMSALAALFCAAPAVAQVSFEWITVGAPASLGFSTAGMYRMILDLSILGISTDVVGLEFVP